MKYDFVISPRLGKGRYKEQKAYLYRYQTILKYNQIIYIYIDDFYNQKEILLIIQHTEEFNY